MLEGKEWEKQQYSDINWHVTYHRGHKKKIGDNSDSEA